ncbi:MAG: bifunctional nuclease domain-containing protein [Actinomycetota bacterium]|nr:bifunctional nuclease domain-containing protein [Actinomycetota bacterium]
MENQTYGKLKIDSRPSDAIALAVRSKCDIYAADHIIQSAGLEIQTIEDEVSQFKDFLEHVTPDDFKQEE